MSFVINQDLNENRKAWTPARFRYWYDSIIDLLLVEPTLSQKEIAARVGRHAVTVGLIMNSDLFRARYEQRRGEQNAQLTQALNTRLARTAIASLEHIEATLQKKRDTIPLPELVDVADKALTRLGYGPKNHAAPVQVNVNNQQVVAPVTAEQLAESRAKLIDQQTKLGGLDAVDMNLKPGGGPERKEGEE